MLILVVWLGVTILCVLPFARFMLPVVAVRENKPDTEDFFLAGFLGVVSAPLWPVILPGVFVGRLLRQSK